MRYDKRRRTSTRTVPWRLEERDVHKLYDLPILMRFLGKNGEKTSGGDRSTAHVFSHGDCRQTTVEH